ncbi:hypothetical protein [Sorangium sp. So ce542]|uniref:hypothetical protein n=1 Tax=Sorangium sp. So ce542 TaxID=3133316 RepID=UPI003F629358
MPIEIEMTEGYPMTTEPGYEAAHEAQLASEEAITRALSAAEQGRWLDAAREFIHAAKAVLVPTGSPSWEIAARNRERLYRNAAFCFERASAAQEARAVFQSLLALDAQHPSTLRALLARFP